MIMSDITKLAIIAAPFLWWMACLMVRISWDEDKLPPKWARPWMYVFAPIVLAGMLIYFLCTLLKWEEET